MCGAVCGVDEAVCVCVCVGLCVGCVVWVVVCVCGVCVCVRLSAQVWRRVALWWSMSDATGPDSHAGQHPVGRTKAGYTDTHKHSLF